MLELVRAAARACSCGDLRSSDSNEVQDADEPTLLVGDSGSFDQYRLDTPIGTPDGQVCKVLSFHSHRGRLLTNASDGCSSVGEERRNSIGEDSVATSGFVSDSEMVMVASMSSMALRGESPYYSAPVAVDRVYDFYDPVEGVSRVVNMNGDVIHRRISSVGRKIEEPTDSDDEERGRVDTDQQRKTVTNWGILVGKAIWCRVHGKLRSRRPQGLATVSVGRLASCYLNIKRASFDVLDDVDEKKKAGMRSTIVGQRHARLIAQNRAKVVISHARELAKRIVKEPNDCLDCDWVYDDILTFLFSAEYADTIMILAKGAQSLLAAQPILVEAVAPCRIFGDTHGQLRDLLLLFRAFGTPDLGDDTTYIFNGDFVDRGRHQLEVVSLLFAFKNLLPNRVFLIRGNHEDRDMNRRYGFQDTCNQILGRELGPKTFDLIHEAFDQLPLACRISKRVLVLHGGIGNGKWRLEDLLSIKRPLKSEIYAEENAWIFNLLWSDPIEDDDARKSHGDIFGVHGSPRNSKVVQFGWNITEQFCAQNGLNLIVRSHQCKEGGYGFDIMHTDKLIRVFSARDYERHRNDCAVLLLTPRNNMTEDGCIVVRPQVLKSVAKPGWAARVQSYDEALRLRRDTS